MRFVSSAAHAIKSAIGRTFRSIATITGFCVLIFGAVFYGGKHWFFADKPLPTDFILKVTLEGDLEERPPNSFGEFLDRSGTHILFHRLMFALDKAADDPRVKGVLVRANGLDASYAQIEELRAAFQKIRSKGKQVWFYTPYVHGLGAYALASASDKLFIQSGSFALPHLGWASLYKRSLFDLLGVVPQFIWRGAYKSGPTAYLDKNMSAKDKEQRLELITEWKKLLLDGIVEQRGLTLETLNDVLNAGLPSNEEILQKRLVDGFAHYQEVKAAMVKTVFGANAPEKPLVPVGKFFQNHRKKMHKRKQKKEPGIGLLVLSGVIEGGDFIAPEEKEAVGALQTARLLEKASKDERIKALVVRVDSPGGSALGSEILYRAMLRFQESGKPLLVSVGNLAASGGQYLAAAGTKGLVYADKFSIMGSIGVYTGKFVASRTLQDHVMNADSVETGANAWTWSAYKPFSKDDTERLEAHIEESYRTFIDAVAHGRGLKHEDVETVAGGRIWSGTKALEHKLIDGIGGLNVVLEKARALAQLDDNCPIYEEPVALSLKDWILAILLGKKEVVGKPFASLKQMMTEALVGAARSLTDPKTLEKMSREKRRIAQTDEEENVRMEAAV